MKSTNSNHNKAALAGELTVLQARAASCVRFPSSSVTNKWVSFTVHSLHKRKPGWKAKVGIEQIYHNPYASGVLTETAI